MNAKALKKLEEMFERQADALMLRDVNANYSK